MIITLEQMQLLKKAPNSIYEPFKSDFLFHSNKLEGSTFSEEELLKLVEQGKISGNHSVEDVLETINSLSVLDYVIDTLSVPITKEYLFELNRLLFKGTRTENEGFAGHYKTIPNRIRNSKVQVALPNEVDKGIDDLLTVWESSNKTFEDIADFHIRFEHIHPFQDGNGRIGRFLMLKQCIENKIDLIVIDAEREQPYKNWLEIAQSENRKDLFYQELKYCQSYYDEKLTKSGMMQLIKPIAQTRPSPAELGKQATARANTYNNNNPHKSEYNRNHHI